MCFKNALGEFSFRVEKVTCAGCGAIEGWKELGQVHLFRFIDHKYITGYGTVDECEALTGSFICPGCRRPVSSHYIDCERDGSGVDVSVSVEQESSSVQ